MLSTVLFLGLVFAAMSGSDAKYPPDEQDTADTFCKNDRDGTGVETFAGSLYSAIVTEHGFDVVAGIEVSGPEAAMSEYNAIFQDLDGQGKCYAADLAFLASRPLVGLKTVPLAVYLEKSSHNMANFVYAKGLLDCSTAIPLVFDFAKLVSNAFQGLDDSKFASYQQALVQGMKDFNTEHGLDVDSAAKDLAEGFAKEFKDGSKNCAQSGN